MRNNYYIVITNENKSTDEKGFDYVYVNDDIYDTEKAYGSDVLLDSTEQLQRIRFKITDNNVLFNKKLTLGFYEVTEELKDGKLVRIEKRFYTLKKRPV